MSFCPFIGDIVSRDTLSTCDVALLDRSNDQQSAEVDYNIGDKYDVGHDEAPHSAICNVHENPNCSIGQLDTVFKVSEISSDAEQKKDVPNMGSMNTGAPTPYYIKQVCLDGRQVNSVVDANNKPILFPSGVHVMNLPSRPIPSDPSQINLGSQENSSDEPLYVNSKQYHRILKRREARAKLEAKGKILKGRQRYQYESRHKHARNRQRNGLGQFLQSPRCYKKSLSNGEPCLSRRRATSVSEIPFIEKEYTQNSAKSASDGDCYEKSSLLESPSMKEELIPWHEEDAI